MEYVPKYNILQRSRLPGREPAQRCSLGTDITLRHGRSRQPAAPAGHSRTTGAGFRASGSRCRVWCGARCGAGVDDFGSGARRSTCFWLGNPSTHQPGACRFQVSSGKEPDFGLPVVGEEKYLHWVFIRILAARSAPPVARAGWLQRRAVTDSVPARDKPHSAGECQDHRRRWRIPCPDWAPRRV
jgi:hypothetical protein